MAAPEGEKRKAHTQTARRNTERAAVSTRSSEGAGKRSEVEDSVLLFVVSD